MPTVLISELNVKFSEKRLINLHFYSTSRRLSPIFVQLDEYLLYWQYIFPAIAWSHREANLVKPLTISGAGVLIL